MLDMLRRRRDEDEGFTLIELMVVVLIIAILIAIAIPTFLGAQNRARDRAAQSDLRNALSAAKTIATDQEGYFRTAATCTGNTIGASNLYNEEASLTYAALPGTEPATQSGTVYVSTAADCSNILLARESASGTWFGLTANQTGAVTYCKGAFTAVNAAASCTATKW